MVKASLSSEIEAAVGDEKDKQAGKERAGDTEVTEEQTETSTGSAKEDEAGGEHDGKKTGTNSKDMKDTHQDAEAAAGEERGLSDKVRQMFIKRDSELIEPDSFAEAFSGSGDKAYAGDDEEDTDNAEPTTCTSASTPQLRTPSSASVHTDETREEAHNKLRAYECARRLSYQTKLSSSSIYWRSVRDLCHESIAETTRAEQMFKGCGHLNSVYATFLQASCDNLLDDQGLPVTDARKKKKLQEVRSPSPKKNEKKGSAAEVNEAATSDDGDSKDKGDKSPKMKVPPSSAFGTSAKDTEHHGPGSKDEEDGTSSDAGGIFDPLYQAHGLMSKQFAEFATFIEEEAVPEVVKIKESLLMQVAMMEKLGDAIVENLEAAEAEVAESWKNYYDVAEKSFSFLNSKEKRRGVHMAAESDPSDADDFVKNCEDVWIKEMKYRMSVAFLSTCWDKSSAEMAKVFTVLKREECSRLFRLRELLSSFLGMQGKLWLSLPPISAPLMKNLVDKPRDPDSIAAEVQSSIRVRAAIKQKEEVDDAIMKEDEEPGPGLSGISTASDGDFELQSPLLSEILLKADLIEVKYSPYLMKPWKTVLAIVTHSSVLHLFNVPSTRYSTPTEAFHALVPLVAVPTEETAKTMNMAKHRKDWYKLLQPSDSFTLANSTVAFKDSEKNAYTFEITEKIQTNAATSMMMRKTTTRKIMMRVLSKDQEKEWIAAMKADK